MPEDQTHPITIGLLIIRQTQLDYKQAHYHLVGHFKILL